MAQQPRLRREIADISGTITGTIESVDRDIIDSLVAAQYEPEIHRSNPDGRYPLCLPRIGIPGICERCNELIRPGDEYPCPAVPRDRRWGPPPEDTPSEAPRFHHDCEDCVYLGRSDDGTRDLYYCHRDGWLNARSSDNGNHRANPNLIGRSEMGHPTHLAEAYRRAVARGLVGGAGEGEGETDT